jgi:ribose transport system substrate-binding protein
MESEARNGIVSRIDAVAQAPTTEIRTPRRDQKRAAGANGRTSMKRIASVIAICAGISGFAGMALAAGVDELPPDIQKTLYNKDQIDPQQPIGPSAYRDWKPKKGPPWTIGYASSYAGNTWRAAALEKLEKELIPKWKKLGLIKDVIVTQSNLKDSVQIQQMRQLVDRGADALIICCSNPTALNETVKYAYDKGVPTFSMVGYVTSPYAVNSSTNFVVTGRKMGDWLVDEIGKKGNVLVVEGIPGTSTSDSLDRGIKSGLADGPDVKIAGDVAGMWTDQVAQAEVQKWLANHPGDLDGVVVQSAAELGVLRALEQSGRKMPPVAIGGEEGALCYWRHHPKYISAAIQGWPPADEMELTWNIMMRTMEGQGPKVESVLVDSPVLHYDEVAKALPETCSEDSDKWFAVGPELWSSGKKLDAFFLRPADPETYKR